MADLHTRMVVDMGGNLASRARSYSQQLSRFASRGQRALGSLSRAASMAGQGIDRLGNRWTALATGAAGIGTVRGIGQLQDQLADLRIAAGMTADRTDALRKRLYEVANLKPVRLDVTQLLAAVKEVQDRSGMLVESREELEALGIAMRATGGDARSMGQIVANAKSNLGIMGASDLLSFLSALAEQGKMAKLRLDEVATVAPTITGAYAATGRVGVEAGKEAMGLAQTARASVRSAEEAATATKAVIRSLLDPTIRKMIKGAGIQIMDPDDPKRMRSVPDILKEIVRHADGDMVRLRKVFKSDEAFPLIQTLAAEFNRSGKFPLLDAMLAVKGDAQQLIGDAEKAAPFSGAIQSLTNAWQKFADAELAEPVQDLANAINELDPEKLDRIAKTIGYSAAAVGGLVLATKAIRGGAAALEGLRRIRGKGGSAAAVAGAAGAAGPMPVVVTNWPPAMGRGKGGAVAAQGRRASAATRGAGRTGLLGSLGRGTKWLGRIGGKLGVPLAALTYGIDGVSAAMAGNTKRAAGAAGGFGGMLAGGAAGAALGSIVPGAGTAIGGLVGSIAGGLGGETLIESLMDWFSDKPKEQETRNRVDVNLKIDSEGRPAVQGLKTDSRDVNVDVDTGVVMAGG